MSISGGLAGVVALDSGVDLSLQHSRPAFVCPILQSTEYFSVNICLKGLPFSLLFNGHTNPF